MITFLFTSCESITILSDSDADIYAKIHNRYSKMESYTAEVTLTVISNKTEKTYKVKQGYLSPDKMVANFLDTGAKAIIKEKNVTLSYGENLVTLPASSDINYLFINEFFKMYYMSQSTALSVASHDRGSTTRLETELISPTSHRYKSVLTINNKTLNPERLSVCDMSGKDVLFADFHSFVYNDKIDENEFTNES